MRSIYGDARKDFIKCYWWSVFLPERLFHLLAYRWFNTKTNVWVDIQNWDGRFDYAVSFHGSDEVFVSNYDSKTRLKDFDKALSMAIHKASDLYNKL